MAFGCWLDSLAMISRSCRPNWLSRFLYILRIALRAEYEINRESRYTYRHTAKNLFQQLPRFSPQVFDVAVETSQYIVFFSVESHPKDCA